MGEMYKKQDLKVGVREVLVVVKQTCLRWVGERLPCIGTGQGMKGMVPACSL